VKNLKYYLLVLGLGMLLLLPLNTKAVDANNVSVEFEKTQCSGGADTEGYCTSTVQVYINVGSNVTNFTEYAATLTYNSGVVVTITPATGVTNKGNNVNMDLVFSTALTAGQKTLVATVTEKYKAGVNCDITFTSTAYGTSTVDFTETTTTTKTGASLPYVILGCGAVAALAIYTATKKQTKLHKI
jgi:hypothetical protein